MIKNFDLKKYNPKTYKFENRFFYFDKDRKFLTEKNEKEEIRQKTIEYIHKELFVPYTAIRTDVAMYNFEKKAKGRADILITALTDDGYDVPIMVIRCTESTKDTKGKAKTEALKQLSSTGSVCAGVTNGKSFDFYVNEEEITEKFEPINYPTLCDLLSLEAYDYEQEPMETEAYSYFYTPEAYDDGITYGIIGEDTKKELAPIILNLNACFMYEDEKIKDLKGKSFKLAEDMGLRFTKAEDGFNANYRLLLIEAKEGIKAVGFAISSCESGRDCTYLTVTVDDANGVKPSTEIKVKIILDDEMKVNENEHSFIINSATLNSDKALHINDEAVLELLAKLIDTALA